MKNTLKGIWISLVSFWLTGPAIALADGAGDAGTLSDKTVLAKNKDSLNELAQTTTWISGIIFAFAVVLATVAGIKMGTKLSQAMQRGDSSGMSDGASKMLRWFMNIVIVTAMMSGLTGLIGAYVWLIY